MADHKSHDKIYWLVFFALLVFTALSFGADVLPIKEAGSEPEPGQMAFSTPVIAVIVLAIAVAKATCVMLFFMHLKWETQQRCLGHKSPALGQGQWCD